MANQTEPFMGVRKQIVMSAPSKLLVGRYLSPKGMHLIKDAKTKKEKANIWSKYGKNRYQKNKEAIPCRNRIGGVKIITHYA